MKAGTALSDPSLSSNSGEKKIYLEASLNYARMFNEKHDVTGLLLYMQKESQYQNKSGLNLLPFRKQSVVARGAYAYDTRYMVEASMGMTGSENFAEGHRWGIFPAVGVAWYVSHEKFMRQVADYISTLKLRVSYGITGNDKLGDDYGRFPYRESVNTGASGYNFGLSPGQGGGASNGSGAGIVERTIAMPALSWEKEKKVNIGIDLGLFEDRVYLSADYFSNRRNDILLQRRTILDVAGMRVPPYQNFGIATNKGFDANLTLKQNLGDVVLSAIGNITYAKNKFIEYDEVTFQGTAHSSVNLMASSSTMMPFTVGKDKTSARALLRDRWKAEEPYNQKVLYPRVHGADFTHTTISPARGGIGTRGSCG